MEITQLETDKVKESYNTQVCTVDDLIKAYGKKAEQHLFCSECAEWKTCRGVKKSTCPYRKWYVKNEIKDRKNKKEINKRWTRLTDETKQKIIDMYKQGYRVYQIANHLEITQATVYNYTRKLKEYKRSSQRFDWTKHNDKLLEMFKGGMFYKDIANYFGVTKNQVHYGISELKKLGVIENIDYRVKGVKRNGR